MAVHLKYGGSVASRTIGCPSWHKLAESVPRSVEKSVNLAADTGTLLHNCMETAYKDDITFVQQLYNGESYNGIALTDDLIKEKLDPALKCVEQVLNELGIESNILLEQFVQIDDDIGGSIDMLALSENGKDLLVLDYKFGYVTVDVEENAQLLFYALAAATDAKTAPMFDKVERIHLVIVQPNDDGADYSRWTIDPLALDAFEDRYFTAISKAETEIVPSPQIGSWCKYCPAHAICPVKTGEAARLSRVNEITADKLAEYLPLADEMIEWAKQVKAMAHEQLELGTSIEGYKLVNKRGTRKWADLAAVDAKVRKARKIKNEFAYISTLKTPPQLEKVCKELGVDFEKEYGQYITSVSSGTTLAKSDDKRPTALPLVGLEQLNALLDQ